jgi:hypothetical protein
MLIHGRNSTVVESPERLPLPVISTIRVLLCLTLAGCSAKDEMVTPPQLQAPTIVAQPTVVVSDLGARITATVNPNNIDTEVLSTARPQPTEGDCQSSSFKQPERHRGV